MRVFNYRPGPVKEHHLFLDDEEFGILLHAVYQLRFGSIITNPIFREKVARLHSFLYETRNTQGHASNDG